MAGRLESMRALVTGASSGIGTELAREVAAHGAELVLVARRKDRLDALAAQIRTEHGVDVHVEVADLSTPGRAIELAGGLDERGLQIDVLINNAGAGEYQDFLDVPWARYREVLELNVVAVTALTHALLPGMIARGRGHIMNVASIAAYLPTPKYAVYASTKAYVRNFTEALDYELRGTGVRAMSMCPGGTRTEFMDRANQQMTPFGDRTLMSADRCAKIAVAAMLRGRRNVVTGVLNSWSMWALRWLPRRLLPTVADRSMRMAVDKGPPKLAPSDRPDSG